MDENTRRLNVQGFRVIIDKEFPDEHGIEIAGLVEKWLCLLPLWLQELRIAQFGSSDDDSILTVAVRYRYRRATIYVRPEWHQWEAPARERYFLHELIHITTDALVSFTQNSFKDFLDTDNVADRIVMNLHDEKVEAMVEDLKEAFLRVARK